MAHPARMTKAVSIACTQHIELDVIEPVNIQLELPP